MLDQESARKRYLEPPMTESLQRVLRIAAARATAEGHHYLGTDHIRYGLRREKAIRKGGQ